jgi:hypothetical protein
MVNFDVVEGFGYGRQFIALTKPEAWNIIRSSHVE